MKSVVLVSNPNFLMTSLKGPFGSYPMNYYINIFSIIVITFVSIFFIFIKILDELEEFSASVFFK